MNPKELANKYYEWVVKGSLPTSPSGNRKDDRPNESENLRSVRKGSTSKVVKMKTQLLTGEKNVNKCNYGICPTVFC